MSQKLTFDYKEKATSENFNQLLKNVVDGGIAQGAGCTFNSSTNLVTITPYVAFVYDTDSTNFVRIEEDSSITVEHYNINTPYLIGRLNWEEENGNTLTYLSVAKSSILDTDIIFCKLNYDSDSNIIIDNSEKTHSSVYYNNFNVVKNVSIRSANIVEGESGSTVYITIKAGDYLINGQVITLDEDTTYTVDVSTWFPSPNSTYYYSCLLYLGYDKTIKYNYTTSIETYSLPVRANLGFPIGYVNFDSTLFITGAKILPFIELIHEDSVGGNSDIIVGNSTTSTTLAVNSNISYIANGNIVFEQPSTTDSFKVTVLNAKQEVGSDNAITLTFNTSLNDSHEGELIDVLNYQDEVTYIWNGTTWTKLNTQEEKLYSDKIFWALNPYDGSNTSIFETEGNESFENWAINWIKNVGQYKNGNSLTEGHYTFPNASAMVQWLHDEYTGESSGNTGTFYTNTCVIGDTRIAAETPLNYPLNLKSEKSRNAINKINSASEPTGLDAHPSTSTSSSSILDRLLDSENYWSVKQGMGRNSSTRRFTIDYTDYVGGATWVAPTCTATDRWKSDPFTEIPRQYASISRKPIYNRLYGIKTTLVWEGTSSGDTLTYDTLALRFEGYLHTIREMNLSDNSAEADKLLAKLYSYLASYTRIDKTFTVEDSVSTFSSFDFSTIEQRIYSSVIPVIFRGNVRMEWDLQTLALTINKCVNMFNPQEFILGDGCNGVTNQHVALSGDTNVSDDVNNRSYQRGKGTSSNLVGGGYCSTDNDANFLMEDSENITTASPSSGTDTYAYTFDGSSAVSGKSYFNENYLNFHKPYDTIIKRCMIPYALSLTKGGEQLKKGWACNDFTLNGDYFKEAYLNLQYYK